MIIGACYSISKKLKSNAPCVPSAVHCTSYVFIISNNFHFVWLFPSSIFSFTAVRSIFVLFCYDIQTFQFFFYFAIKTKLDERMRRMTFLRRINAYEMHSTASVRTANVFYSISLCIVLCAPRSVPCHWYIKRISKLSKRLGK